MTWGELLAAAEAVGVQSDDKVGFLHVYPLGAREPNARELDIHRDDAGYVTISLLWQSGAVKGHKFEDASIKPMGKKRETCSFCRFDTPEHHPDCPDYRVEFKQ